jgi:lipopolysaccharide export system protein LptA
MRSYDHRRSIRKPIRNRLIRALPALLLVLAPSPFAAPAAAGEPMARIPAISVLPPGSELRGVMLPRYDENRRLVGVLRAASMKLIDETQIEGNRVSLEFFNPDRSPRGRIDLITAHLNQASGHITGTGTVSLRSDRLNATGEGLIYAHDSGELFLAGATNTQIKPAPATAMNRSRPLQTAALLGLSLVAAPAQSPPAPVTTEQEAAMLADAAPSDRAAANGEGRAELQQDLEASAAASRAMASFLENAANTGARATEPAAPPKLHVAPDAPLPATHGPEDIIITSTHGMFFNPVESVFVYLGDVKVDSPQLTLSGANELKIFFAQKEPAPPAAGDEPPDADNPLSGFGEVDRIVATGAVRIKATPEDGEPVEAAGAIFSYNVASEQIVLRGGYPWVSRAKQGNFRAQQPDLTLRVDLKSGEVVTEGHWETGLQLKNIQDRGNR